MYSDTDTATETVFAGGVASAIARYLVVVRIDVRNLVVID